tara:strand:+ start:695 stop:1276 length:582 start_codon:yes stop_codon:yes gene_type:complete
MKVFITVLVLFFSLQSLSKADDIRDFEIEGISIGDNLLDYVNLKKIDNNISNESMYDGTNFKRTCIDEYGPIYDRVCVTYLNNKKKIIQSVQGILNYDKFNYKICNSKMNNIDNELSNLFKNLKKKDWDLLEISRLKEKYPGSTYHPITYDFQDQSRIQLACYNYPTINKTFFKIVVYNFEIRKLVSSVAVEK